MLFGQRFDAEVGYGLGSDALWYFYFVADDSGWTRFGLKLSSGQALGVGLEFGLCLTDFGAGGEGERLTLDDRPRA